MKKTYLIANSHIDPVWLWRWQEGFAEVLATFRSALDRLKDFPELKFTSACAAYYEWIEKADPEMFAEIQQRIAEGRWCVVGGWYIQPDCNIPSGESLARHSLLSQRFFMEKFGKTAETGYNVDSFGHNASIPMILRKSGMKNYVFMRPSPRENGALHDLFEWTSPNGSSVRTFRIPYQYNISSGCIGNLDRIIESSEKQPMMAFIGIGNHGGGPTVRLINEINAGHRPDGVEYSTPDEFFEDTKDFQLPVVKGELQHHARGCYSANSFVKRSNRAAEYALYAAETMSVLADALTGKELYPSEKLREAWKYLLFNQFHDIMGGCAIKSAYTDAGHLYGAIFAVTEQVINIASTRIARRIDTLHGRTLPSVKTNWRLWDCGDLGSPVIVFNPHARAVTATVELTVRANEIRGDDGEFLPSQIVRAEHTNGEDKYGTVFRAEIPALGYRVFRVFTEGEKKSFPVVEADCSFLENRFVRVEFDRETGEISRFTDKRTGENIISERTGAILVDETLCDTWAHDRESLGKEVGRFGGARMNLIEKGAVRSTVRATSFCGNSTLRRDYTLERDSDTLIVNSAVDFHEKHRALKLVFPAAEEVLASIPFGSLKRPLGSGEEPCGEWLSSGRLGFASDITYGYDTVAAEKVFRPTILRGAIFADHYGSRDELCEYMDQGETRFRYTLFPASSASDSKKRADELNCAVIAINDTFHDGNLGGEYEGFSCDEEIVVSALKRGEDGGKVLRLVEENGARVKSAFTLFGERISFELAPHDVITLVDGKETDFLEK